MDIRTGPVMDSHGFPHLPVPVGTQAIAPAIPGAQHKPGKSSQPHGYQMPFSCFWKCPANNIEQGKQGMKNKEEDIEESISHFYSGMLR